MPCGAGGRQQEPSLEYDASIAGVKTRLMLGEALGFAICS
jgi:hypothetical protein